MPIQETLKSQMSEKALGWIERMETDPANCFLYEEAMEDVLLENLGWAVMKPFIDKLDEIHRDHDNPVEHKW